MAWATRAIRYPPVSFVGRISREFSERRNPTAVLKNINYPITLVGLRCSLWLTPNSTYRLQISLMRINGHVFAVKPIGIEGGNLKFIITFEIIKNIFLEVGFQINSFIHLFGS